MAAVLGVRFLAACSLLAAARGGSLRFLSMAAGAGCNFAQETQGRRSVICATWTEQANGNEGVAQARSVPYMGVGRGELSKKTLPGWVGDISRRRWLDVGVP